jgi:hypothetical protein
MQKVATDAQLSDSLHYGNIRYVIHKHYMQYVKNVKYESYSRQMAMMGYNMASRGYGQ